MKRAALRIVGISRSVLLFALMLTAGLVAIGLWTFRAPPPPTVPFLTGTYHAEDGDGHDAGIYYVQRSSNTLWWVGMSLDKEPPSADFQWHRGLDFTNVFRGTINSDNTVTGEWYEVPRGASLNGGTLSFRFSSSGGVTQFTRIAATGNFPATTWQKREALDDLGWNGDIKTRFDQVHKNDGSNLNDNLKPYRDQTVLYGHLVNSHLSYLKSNCLEFEIPHVNYGPAFDPPIPNTDAEQCGDKSTFLNFGKRDREFDSFACFHASDGDGDFDMRLRVDLNKLEPDFYTTGWGDRISGPQVFALKLNDADTRHELGFTSNEGYMGLESLMYGRQGTCDDGQVSPINGGQSMLPGWADLSSNSVLINGRPINGVFGRRPSVADCDFFHPCPYITGVTPDNYLDVPAGIRFGNLLLSAHGKGQVDADGIARDGPGTYLRVTGALVLDCGHFDFPDTAPCYDDNGPDDTSGHSNQEIHPVYSIDVINFPYRPEDINIQGSTDLTGTYGGTDGSTYYVRQSGSTNVHQLGRTIWWLGLMRDRQPMQRGGKFPMIGSNAIDPSCSSGQCWAFANVFKGTITESPPADAVIEGDWVGVPQSTFAGSPGGHIKFFVFNHKIIIPATPSIFPVTIEKMYDAPDQSGSAGNLP
jgi:hypothetical protein